MINKNIKNSWGLFLIHPFSCFIMALRNYKMRYSKNIFWAFCMFFGLTFAIGKESDGSDINHYVKLLGEFHNMTDLSELLIYFSFSGEIDLFKIFFIFSLSRISDSQVLLTTSFAVLFGFFYSRNIWYILNLIKGKLRNIGWLVAISLILVVPIWNINGIRMYLAFHVFMYGLLPFIFEKKYKKLIFVLLSLLIHFSFIVPTVVLIFYMLIGNKVKLYFIAFVLSIFVSELAIDKINIVANKFLPEAVIERTDSYISEEAVESFNERKIHSNWYVKWHRMLMNWVLMFFLIIVYLRNNCFNVRNTPLMCLSLLFFTTANMLSGFPSGARFYILGYFLSLALLLLIIQNETYKIHQIPKYIKVFLPIFLLYIIVSIRMGLYNASFQTLFGNIISTMATNDLTISINDLLK